MRIFRATARREGKWWVVEIPELGQTTQARSISEIQGMATDLAAIIVDVDPVEVEIEVSIRTPELLEGTWQEAREKTRRAQELTLEAAAASRIVVRSLRSSGYTLKDIGAVLGLSHQRVSQLLADKSLIGET